MKPILTVFKLWLVGSLAGYLLKVVLALYRWWWPCLVDWHPIDPGYLSQGISQSVKSQYEM